LGSLDFWVRKLEGKILDMFSCLKDFVKENSVETNDTGTHNYTKYHFVNIQFRFSNYFPEAVTDKYKWIMDPFPC
jgi:hypothetical protein